MELPPITRSINPASKSPSKKTQKEIMDNVELLKENFSPFLQKMNKIIEIRIYLKATFHKSDIDDNFIRDLEIEYAEQYLNKMEYIPTKENIKKLLSLKPIEHCDFHLSTENIEVYGSDKQVKVIHIYPNNNNIGKKNAKEKLKYFLSNPEFEEVMKKNEKRAKNRKLKEDPIEKIKNNDAKNVDNLIYNKETVDNLFAKARDDILDKQLYSSANMEMNIDLSIENVRKNFIILPISDDNSSENRIFNTKGKFLNISKVSSNKKNILNDPKHQFPILGVENLDKETIKEVTQPLETPMEVIMKDINYILDNFPIEGLVSIEGNKEEVTSSNANNENMHYKISIGTKQELISIYKHLQTQCVYRIVGLTMNLLYWIIFGQVRRIQIDNSTKQCIYIKLLKEIQMAQNCFINKRLYIKIFFPLLIIIIRIEAENMFSRKFKLLFKDEKNKVKAMNKANDIISEIFDPHCYFNTFTIMSGNAGILKHKTSNSLFPRYKEKVFATSNLVEQMFNNDNRDIDNSKRTKYENKELDNRKKYIMNYKIDFFSDMLDRVNMNLKKRNLEPIFSVNRKPVNENNRVRKLFKSDNVDIEKDNNGNENVNNERYDDNVNVIYYIEHSKLKDLN
jgi:hypothetical protein